MPIRQTKFFACHLGALSIALAASSTATAQTVAFVARAVRAGNDVPWTQVAHVERNGRRLAVSGRRFDFEPGDKLFVDQSNAIVLVHILTDNSFKLVRPMNRREADWEAKPQALRGLLGGVLGWFEEQLSGADQSRMSPDALATLGTRGGELTRTCYNERSTDVPTPFAMPVFRAEQSSVLGGRRALLVPWSGGAVPFEIRLSDARSGTEVARLVGISGRCAARLPEVDLKPGRYRIAVKDAEGATMEESNLVVGDTPPAMPEQLRDAPLPEIDRQIYYATWLSSIDGGRWNFEALQMVAALDCRTSAVSEWLARWGGAQLCGT
ncbi:MAG TPA: hypothetical protein VFW19_10945 [Allosphingosinicella sp.]|nr:hypothetical protein [Allosphingosinicella sp.]